MMSDEDALLFANGAFYAAFARGDLAAMAELWSRDLPIACVHPGWAPLIGYEAVMESWQGILAGPPAIRAGRARVFLYGDMGFVLCHEYLQDAVLAATNVFVREGERWVLVHHQAGPVQQVDVQRAPEPTRQLH